MQQRSVLIVSRIPVLALPGALHTTGTRSSTQPSQRGHPEMKPHPRGMGWVCLARTRSLYHSTEAEGEAGTPCQVTGCRVLC